MIVRMRLGPVRIAFTIGLVEDVVGINSWLGGDDHVLFWDFDGLDLETVKRNLRRVMKRYKLPDVHIFSMGKPNSYTAMCFARFHIKKVIEILAATEGEDLAHLRFGCFRKRWTIRLSDKCGRSFRYVCTLKGYRKPDVSPWQLKSWVAYETRPDGYTQWLLDMERLVARKTHEDT
jgi:hypothetical protein